MKVWVRLSLYSQAFMYIIGDCGDVESFSKWLESWVIFFCLQWTEICEMHRFRFSGSRLPYRWRHLLHAPEPAKQKQKTKHLFEIVIQFVRIAYVKLLSIVDLMYQPNDNHFYCLYCLHLHCSDYMKTKKKR